MPGMLCNLYNSVPIEYKIQLYYSIKSIDKILKCFFKKEN